MSNYNSSHTGSEIDGAVTKVNASGVTQTELSYLDGLASNIQTQLGLKAALNDNTQDIIANNITVHGTLLTKDSQNVNIGDAIITLNAEETGTPSENAGFEIERGTSTNTVLRWNESTDRWQFTNDGTTYYNIPITSELGSSTFRTVTAGGNTLGASETLAFTAGSNVTITENAGAVTIAATDTNTFRTITAGGNTLGSSETLAFVAGSNVTISESGGSVTIASTDTNTVDMGDGFKLVDADSNNDVTEGHYVKFVTQQGSGGVGVVTGAGSSGDPHLVTLNYADTNTTYSVMGSGNSYAAGLVLAGASSHGNTYLRKDGTWDLPSIHIQDDDGDSLTVDIDEHIKITGTGGISTDWTTDDAGSGSGTPNILTIGLGNITQVGALSQGSIASGFSTIDEGFIDSDIVRKNANTTITGIYTFSGKGIAINAGTANDASGYDASLYISASQDNDWGIWIDKTTLNYGMKVDVAADASSAFGVYNDSTNRFMISGSGVVTTGTWNGTVIASAYLDADTAHLSGTQTFSGAKTFSSTTTFSNTSSYGDLDIIPTSSNVSIIKHDNGSGSLTLRGDQIRLQNKDGDDTGLTYNDAGGVTFGGDVIVPQKIVHSGDTDTYLSFGTDSLSLYTGGTNVLDFIYGNIYIKGNNKALVGYNTSGSAKELIKINGSDVVQIGEGLPVQIGYSNATPKLEWFYDHSNGTDYKANISLAGNDLEIRGSSGVMEFYTGAVDGASSTLAMTINSSQAVGIGSTPTDRLCISDGASMYGASSDRMIQLKRNATNGNDSSSFCSILFGNNSNGMHIGYGGTTDRFRFVDGGGVERLSLLNGGKFGVGTIAPDSLIHAKVTTNTSETIRIQNDDSLTTVGVSSDGYSFHTYQHSLYWASWDGSTWSTKARLTNDGEFILKGTSLAYDFGDERGQLCISSTDHASNNNYAVLQLQGHSNANSVGTGGIYFYDHSNNVAIIQADRATGTTSSNLLFYTNAGSGVTERMRIKSTGNVAIGGTGGYQKLSVEGGHIYMSTGYQITWSNGNATIANSGYELRFSTYSGSSVIERMRIESDGDVHCDADVIAYSNTIGSDRRLKKNIEDISYGLNDVLKLRGVEFDWNRKDYAKKHDVGFIAQEVREVIPELVKRTSGLNDKGSFLTVDYAKLVPVLVESIKELKKEIEDLKNGSN